MEEEDEITHLILFNIARSISINSLHLKRYM
jgi:hypothetical protein